jgi:hypothetical protein
MNTIVIGTTLWPVRLITMRNRNLSEITELRCKAAQWRRHAAETHQPDYVEMMDRAANDLEGEANKLERRALFNEESFLLLAS